MKPLLYSYYWIADNVLYASLLSLTFLGVTLGVFGITYLWIRRNPAEERLGRLIPVKETALLKKPKLLDKGPDGFVARFTKPINTLVVPQTSDLGRKTRLRLIQAGYRSASNFQYFVAAKIMLLILFPFVYLASRFFYTFSLQVVLFTLLLVIVGFGLPDLILGYLIRSRQGRIIKALPDALDLMVVCVEAGLGLDMTFKRVGDEIRPICPDLSDEFNLTTLEVRAGKNRGECFKNMALRTGVPEVGNLMTILIQTSRFGTSLAKALRVHSDAMRIKRRQIAEETAAKSTVKLIFPLVCFIFPAIFVVLVGPGVIRIIKVLFTSI
jgi:tight adherence protein C